MGQIQFRWRWPASGQVPANGEITRRASNGVRPHRVIVIEPLVVVLELLTC
jgi:hypothetical protein